MDWNWNGKHDSQDDYISFRMIEEEMEENKDDGLSYYSSANNSGRSQNKAPFRVTGLGCAVIVLVGILFFCMLFSGEASSDGIDSLLGLGFLAFIFAQWISK